MKGWDLIVPFRGDCILRIRRRNTSRHSVVQALQLRHDTLYILSEWKMKGLVSGGATILLHPTYKTEVTLLYCLPTPEAPALQLYVYRLRVKDDLGDFANTHTRVEREVLKRHLIRDPIGVTHLSVEENVLVAYAAASGKVAVYELQVDPTDLSVVVALVPVSLTLLQANWTAIAVRPSRKGFHSLICFSETTGCMEVYPLVFKSVADKTDFRLKIPSPNEKRRCSRMLILPADAFHNAHKESDKKPSLTVLFYKHFHPYEDEEEEEEEEERAGLAKFKQIATKNIKRRTSGESASEGPSGEGSGKRRQSKAPRLTPLSGGEVRFQDAVQYVSEQGIVEVQDRTVSSHPVVLPKLLESFGLLWSAVVPWVCPTRSPYVISFNVTTGDVLLVELKRESGNKILANGGAGMVDMADPVPIAVLQRTRRGESVASPTKERIFSDPPAAPPTRYQAELLEILHELQKKADDGHIPAYIIEASHHVLANNAHSSQRLLLEDAVKGFARRGHDPTNVLLSESVGGGNSGEQPALSILQNLGLTQFDSVLRGGGGGGGVPKEIVPRKRRKADKPIWVHLGKPSGRIATPPYGMSQFFLPPN